VDPDCEGNPGSGQALTVAVVTEVIGVVTEQLPSALYRVRLEAGGFVTAHVADRIDRNFVRVLVGDRVRVELSPVDITRGRIVARV
jgi:translation initiation factor IF-1